ncbi:TonB-dependent receptor domain-containing protein [Novosphingobium sp. 9]|uniref:TonB-dependent receptor domain-containing protein n=1 Tax=Novosphingobium sp. 9 TaxID=2025349 RepID=UPI0021B68E94|nr:TonB-dependent receptor [Novosphingobium sp. 9]
MQKIVRKAALCGATYLTAAALLSSPALAQDATQASGQASGQTSFTSTPETVDDATAENAIIVTGSRLGKTAVAAQPTITLQGSTLADLGYTNIGQALTESPLFGVPGNSNAGSQGSFGAGQTFVNMYDLGAQRTLTLVNGNRFVSAGSSSIFGAVQGSPVDLGQIAPGLVDHIDTVSVGGAPIYGSDAIAGTVNVVLKKDYQGFSATGSYGLAAKGDAPDYNLSVLMGKNFDEGRGNVTLNLYYDHQKGLPTSARSATDGTSTFFGADPTGTYSYARYTGGKHYSVFTNTGMPILADTYPIINGEPYGSITNASGQALYFNKAGQLTVFNNGTALADGISQAGGDGFAIDDYGNLLANNQRFQGTLLANYEFSDALRFHGEFWLGHSKASNVADQPFYNTYLFADAGDTNGNLILSTSNPYLSAADQATIKANLAAAGLPTDQFYLARANTDLSTGAFTTTTTLVRGVGGFDGDFHVGSHNFTWEATLNYGRISSNTKTREIVTQNYNNALDAVLDSSGNIVCNPGYTSASIPTLNSTCAPLDIFGNGNASQAALDYITALAKTHQVNTQLDIVADVKGDILTLPAGKVQFVLGYEHRRESQDFNPGDFYRGELQSDGTYLQYGNSVPMTAVSGAYHTDEGFGEITIPLISHDMNAPLIRAADFHGAARYTDNNLTGGSWSYTAGGTLETVAGLTLRGNYTQSFRSPSVTELFAPTGSVYETANDPCDFRYIDSGPNPSVRAANCAAAGLSPDFQSNIVDYTAKGTSSGNTGLRNELAKSWTAGVAFAPSYVPGLSITADYVSINISNEISQPGMTSLMNACYDSTDYPNSSACSTFTRDSDGQVVDFQDNYLNIAIEKFRAVQAAANYTLPLSDIGLPDKAGALKLGVTWLHTTKHYYKVGLDDNTQVKGGYTDPVDSVQGNIDWGTKRFDWLWQVTYYGPSKIDPNAGEGTYEYPRMSPYWMINTSVGVKVTDNFKIRMIVDNVFNLGVPSPYTTTSANKYFDAIMGRYFRLNASVDF